MRQLLDGPVEVRLEQPVLHDAVFLKFTFGKRLRHFGADFAWMQQQLAFIELEERIQLGRPILHRHRDAAFGLILGVVEIHGHDAIQRLEFLFRQVVLRDDDIRFEKYRIVQDRLFESDFDKMIKMLPEKGENS